MWPPWGKLKIPRGTKAATAAFSKSKPSPSFASKSLKDVLFLLRDAEDEPGSCLSPSPSRSSSTSPAPVLHRVRSASSALRSWRSFPSSGLPDDLVPSGEEKRIVLYYTSLRVVRKTFEDCYAVRSILRGFHVAVDERDVSMDSGFLIELEGLLGGKTKQHPGEPSLPQVFIGGRHVGGADEIRQLHESGDLKRYVEGVAPADTLACEGCGGVRFLLCGSCGGSHKCFAEKGDGFRSCTACNESGLVRCPQCS